MSEIEQSKEELKNYYALMEFCKHNNEARDRLEQLGRYVNKLEMVNECNEYVAPDSTTNTNTNTNKKEVSK